MSGNVGVLAKVLIFTHQICTKYQLQPQARNSDGLPLPQG